MMMVLMGGCSLFTQVDGTWLFHFEYESSYSGDCADDGDSGAGDVVYVGTHDVLVDIYSSGGGDVVVLLDEALTGTVEGGELDASWEDSRTYDDATSAYGYRITGTLGDGTLSGEYEAATEYSGPGDDYSCSQSTAYEAERLVSDPDDYVGD
jgi:hypothetical protein